MVERAFNDEAFPAMIAHRGASSTHPENTLPAFEAALFLGAQIVELDVRLSADGVAVVIHDPDVSRTTSGAGLVHELTYDQIRRLDAGTPELPAEVPSLYEVLELPCGRGAVALEIKNLPGDPGYDAERERIAEAALVEVGRTEFEGPVLVVSFNPRSIAASKAIEPGVPTGLLTTVHVDPHEALGHVAEAGHDFVLPGTEALVAVGRTFVQEAHAAGVRVGTWTVDDPDRIRTFLDWGVDAIASNDPAMALRVLAEHRG